MLRLPVVECLIIGAVLAATACGIYIAGPMSGQPEGRATPIHELSPELQRAYADVPRIHAEYQRRTGLSWYDPVPPERKEEIEQVTRELTTR